MSEIDSYRVLHLGITIMNPALFTFPGEVSPVMAIQVQQQQVPPQVRPTQQVQPVSPHIEDTPTQQQSGKCTACCLIMAWYCDDAYFFQQYRLHYIALWYREYRYYIHRSVEIFKYCHVFVIARRYLKRDKK